MCSLEDISHPTRLLFSFLFRIMFEADCFIFGRPSHMIQLRNACKSKSITWRTIPGGSHNDTVAEPYYFNYITEFVNDMAKRASGNL